MPGPHLPHLGRKGSGISHSEMAKMNLHIKIVVLGSPRVGKTAIVSQFLYSHFPETYTATVDELHRTEYEIKGFGTLVLDILDTSGSHEFPAMKRLAIESADAYLLVFSLTDSSTFEEVRHLRDLIIQTKSAHASKSKLINNIFHQNNNNNNNNNNINNNNHVHKQDTSNILSKKSNQKHEDDAGDGVLTCEPIPCSPPIVVAGNKSDLDSMRVIKKELAETIITIDWENGYVEASAKEGYNIAAIFQEMMIQVGVPYKMGNAIGNPKIRRKSLPAYPTSPMVRDRVTPKRNSCAVS